MRRGRRVSRDPIFDGNLGRSSFLAEEDLFTRAEANEYAYVYQQPTRWTDPSGEFCAPDCNQLRIDCRRKAYHEYLDCVGNDWDNLPLVTFCSSILAAKGQACNAAYIRVRSANHTFVCSS